MKLYKDKRVGRLAQWFTTEPGLHAVGGHPSAGAKKFAGVFLLLLSSGGHLSQNGKLPPPDESCPWALGLKATFERALGVYRY